MKTMMACPCSKVEAGTLGPDNSRTAEQGRVIIRKQKGISGKSEQIKKYQDQKHQGEQRSWKNWKLPKTSLKR